MLNEIADQYFQTLNPLAVRISEDILEVKAAGKNLHISEQDESLIYQQVLLASFSHPALGIDDPNYSNRGKIVTDEQTGTSWFDEHSAPFSWKTRSLLALCTSPCCKLDPSIEILPRKFSNSSSSAIENIKNKENTPVDYQQPTTSTWAFSSFCTKLKSLQKTSLLSTFDDKKFLAFVSDGAEKFHNAFKAFGGKVRSSRGDSEALVRGITPVIVSRPEKTNIQKPVSPPPSPPVARFKVVEGEINEPLVGEQACSASQRCLDFEENDYDDRLLSKEGEENVNLVPKSGFDFLDNW